MKINRDKIEMSTADKVLINVLMVLIVALLISTPFAIRDCIKHETQKEVDRAECAQKGGVWLWREAACVAGPK